jgi:hypothetical protein
MCWSRPLLVENKGEMLVDVDKALTSSRTPDEYLVTDSTRQKAEFVEATALEQAKRWSK